MFNAILTCQICIHVTCASPPILMTLFRLFNNLQIITFSHGALKSGQHNDSLCPLLSLFPIHLHWWPCPVLKYWRHRMHTAEKGRLKDSSHHAHVCPPFPRLWQEAHQVNTHLASWLISICRYIWCWQLNWDFTAWGYSNALMFECNFQCHHK